MFATRLKVLRTDKAITQVKLAEMLGVAQQTVASWEKGKSYPNYELLKKIAHIFNSSIDYLIGYDSPVRTELATEKPFTDEEMELIKLYRFTDEWGREQIMSFAESNAKRIAFTQKKRLGMAM